MLVIDVLHNGGDLGMALYKGVHKLLRGRENGFGSDQRHHDLPGTAGGTHLDIAKKARSAVLVVDADLEGLHERKHCLYDPVRAKVFKHAGLDRNHFVRSRLVDAAYRLAFLVRCEYRCHLIAVMVRILHPYDRIHPTEFPDQFLHQLLLSLCLLRVRNVDHCAATALFGHGASGFFAVCSVFSRLNCKVCHKSVFPFLIVRTCKPAAHQHAPALESVS